MLINHIQSILGNTLGRQLCEGSPGLGQLLQLPTQFFTFPRLSRPKNSDLHITDLPSDVLYLIADQLDAPSAFALSLTCRAMYCAGLPVTQGKLQPAEKMELLVTLERDSSCRDMYYCHKCNILHRYEKSWGPYAEGDMPTAETPICQARDRFCPSGNAYNLSYHHARLAMNAHLYGPDHGIPLENICVSHEQRRQATYIRCDTSARIVDDQLFLLRSYEFVVPEGGVQDFRRCPGIRDFRLCEHLPFFRNASIYGQSVSELMRRPRSDSNGKTPTNSHDFVPCTDSQGGCGLCMLDYDITICQDRSGVWQVKINAYHQLGDCRSPDEWMWARFTEKSRLNLFLPCRPNRRGFQHLAGCVKKRWLEGDRSTIVRGTANVPQKRHHL